MSSENSFKKLEGEVKQLEDILSPEVFRSQKATRNSMVISLSAISVIAIFFTIIVVHFNREWTEDNISQNLEREMMELSPAAMKEINTLGKDLLPVYAEETRRQFEKMGPDIAKYVEQEVQELSNELLAGVEKRLTESQERVLTRTEELLANSYPSLVDPVQKELIANRFHSVTEDAVTKAIGNFQARFGQHVDKVWKAMLEFDLSDSNETPVDLQKKFIHLWLQLLDQEIMEL